jgi:hypothetical protein
MKPGPKPKNKDDLGRPGIDLGWLKSQAYVWNLVLHEVRDGQPGFIAKIVSCGPRKPKLKPVMGYLSFHDLLSQSERRRRGLALAGDGRVDVVIVSAVPPQRFDEARELVRGQKGYVLTPPILPRRELWEGLKNARSAADVQRIARKLHLGWYISAAQWAPLHCHAQDLVRARQLHNYPDSKKRASSDEKRIHFFAKVLSGLMQGPAIATKVRLRINGRRRTILFCANDGISPATATKRLARLPLPNKEDFNRYWKEHAAWYSKPKHRKRPMTRLVQYERQAATGEWLAVYQDQTDHIWREKISAENAAPTERNN